MKESHQRMRAVEGLQQTNEVCIGDAIGLESILQTLWVIRAF